MDECVVLRSSGARNRRESCAEEVTEVALGGNGRMDSDVRRARSIDSGEIKSLILCSSAVYRFLAQDIPGMKMILYSFNTRSFEVS
jgi:hypothetical protein